jgi:hypothetical protein
MFLYCLFQTSKKFYYIYHIYQSYFRRKVYIISYKMTFHWLLLIFMPNINRMVQRSHYVNQSQSYGDILRPVDTRIYMMR